MTSSGVPVGDTTLLDRIKELEERIVQDREWRREFLERAEAAEAHALAQSWVIELADKMRARISSVDYYERELGRWNECAAYDEARAALAPFVGEATQ